MDVLSPVRKFLAWERRAFLGEEDWEFPTTRDMSGITQALDQRLRRRPAQGNTIVWCKPWHTLAVHMNPHGRIEFFGHRSFLPRHLGFLYFDGQITVTDEGSAIVGRLRLPKVSGSFLLLCTNFLMLWLLIAVAMFFHDVISCVTGVDYGCDTVANAGILVGFGAVTIPFTIGLLRYVLSGAIFTRGRLRALLTDLAGIGAPI